MRIKTNLGFIDSIVASSASQPFRISRNASSVSFRYILWTGFCIGVFLTASLSTPPIISACLWFIAGLKLFPAFFLGLADRARHERMARLDMVDPVYKAILSDQTRLYDQT